jgi:aspartate/methionine/tyrosine aminotransferase
MRLASRLQRVQESATLRLTRRRAAELRGAPAPTWSTWEPASPTSTRREMAVEAAQRALDEGHTRYTEVGGELPTSRRALAARYERLGAPLEPCAGG